MLSSKDEIKKELDGLMQAGKDLIARIQPELEDSVCLDYQAWYTVSLRLVKQLIPERFTEFASQYEPSYDYLSRINRKEMIDHEITARNRLLFQISILAAAQKTMGSALSDIEETLQLKLFEDELAAAHELCDNGHIRAAGVLGGVTLERCLGRLCAKHELTITKNVMSISEYNDFLKSNNVIDMPKLRFIQYLTEVRNLCSHDKGQEPTKEEINDFLEGVKTVIKTYF